ncbi:MAG: CopG family transcriptional regulator [Terrimicrobiaceae bacterium]
MMRTTLDIENDVLEVAKSLARHQRLSLGKAVSDLIRKSLKSPVHNEVVRNGLRIITRRPDAESVTLDIVNKLRDE